jgi:hypothetical protein
MHQGQLHMLLAVAAQEKHELRQFDIKTAFLNGPLQEEVYLQPPAGLEGLARRGSKVLRLQCALYGLQQASSAWNKRLEVELTHKSLVQSDADPALWILHVEGGAVLAMSYVDDGVVKANAVEQTDALVELVASMFAIRALGEPEDFLGIQISRDRAVRTISIVQEHKALELAVGLGVGEAPKPAPVSPETSFGLRAAQEGESTVDKLEYQRIVGSLLHLAQCTRPDIALAVGALAAFCAAPSEVHHKALLNVVCYVGSTAERGITFGGSERASGSWCDTNFAACQDTRCSTTGWNATMYGGAVSWSSKKQPTTAASTMDAEYQACLAAAREGLPLSRHSGRWSYSPRTFPLRNLL